MNIKWWVATVCLSGMAAAVASPMVVADSACPLHAVDIEAFATCDGDRVAKPDEETAVDSSSASVTGPTDQARTDTQERPRRGKAPASS
jgi:hypothetical protein